MQLILVPAYHFGTQRASSTAKTTKCCWYISDRNTSLHLKLVIMDSGLTKIRWYTYLPSASILSSFSFSPHTKATERPRDAKEATYTIINTPIYYYPNQTFFMPIQCNIAHVHVLNNCCHHMLSHTCSTGIVNYAKWQ